MAWSEDFDRLKLASAADPPPLRPRSRDVSIPVGSGAQVAGDLEIPAGARALVVFAHGSGSSRSSPRNRQVAAALNLRGMATLLFDLLTAAEELDRDNVFDIPLLAGRLVAATRWARTHPEIAGMPVSYFGASTGAGAALWAAAEPGADITAVVSRGGRPDLAAGRLASVLAPVLLIVGGRDPVVLELNRQAASAIAAPCELSVVAGATHLFEEPGALERVCELAGDWIERHLRAAVPSRVRTEP